MAFSGSKHHNWKGGRNAAVYRYHRKQQDLRREFANQHKSKPCADCGGSFPPYVMHFDHRDPTLKIDNISRMTGTYVKLSIIKAEIEKCDVVCANCHHIRTYKQQQKQRAANEQKNSAKPNTSYEIKDQNAAERAARWRERHPDRVASYNKANWKKYAPPRKDAA